MQTKAASDDKLSPFKIAILILVSLYVKNELPSKRQALQFLAKRLEDTPIVSGNKLVLLTNLNEFCDSIYLPNSNEDKKYADSLAEFRFRFLQIAWNLNTADSLQQLSMDIYRQTADPFQITTSSHLQISARSPIGRFVRSMAASLKLLLFEESSVLVGRFCKYRASSLSLYLSLSENRSSKATALPLKTEVLSQSLFPTWNTLQRIEFRNKNTGGRIRAKLTEEDENFFKKLDSVFLESTETQTSNAYVDIDSSDVMALQSTTLPDLNVLINEQARLLEIHGTPTPDYFKEILRQMALPELSSMYNTMPSLHYLQYLESLQRGDYVEASVSLHKYFDYMVSQGSKYFYHFALVSKASLHQHFGEYEEALDSMEEAISIARENRDNATLTYVLSWLYDFMRKKPSLWTSKIFRQIKNELRLLDYLVKKSLSVSISLATISYRFEAEHLLNGRCHFSKYYESLFKAGYFAVNDSILSFIGVCHSAAKLWDHVGYLDLHHLYLSLGLRYSKSHGSLGDTLMFSMAEARYNYLSGDNDLMLPDIKSDLELCNSNVTQFKHVRVQLLLRQIEVTISKGRTRLARELMQYIPENVELNDECFYEKCKVGVLLEVAEGNYSDGLMYASSNISDMNKLRSSLRPDIVHLMELNFLKAVIFVKANVPYKAFSLIVQQLETANQLGLRSLTARGYILLVELLTKSGDPSDAIDISNSVLPLVLSVGNNSVISHLFFQIASAHQQLLHKDAERLRISKKSLFANFLNYLSLSISGFKRNIDLEMLIKCFKLENEMAETAERHSEIRNSKPFENFCKHSQLGLEILRRRSFDEAEYAYLQRVT